MKPGSATEAEDGAWRVLSRRSALDARPWLRAWFESILLPDGRIVDDFVTLEQPDYAVVVPLTQAGEAIVERNYKHGPRRACLNLPAGYLGSGEDPLEAAKRELREETGYVADTWRFLGRFTHDGNRGSGVGHLYLAENSRKVTEPDAGDLEAISVETMPFDRLLLATRTGEVAVLSNAAAIGLAAALVMGIREPNP